MPFWKSFTPTARLALGAFITLLILVAYAAYTLRAIAQLREVQRNTVERNRKASLQLIRIQSELNSLTFALRDMIDPAAEYPLLAWRAQLERTHESLQDAVQREQSLAGNLRDAQQAQYLAASFEQFWTALDQVFQWAANDEEARARQFVQATLLPRQEALKALVARLLVDNVEADERAATEIAAIYAGIEQSLYRFLLLGALLIGAVAFLQVRANRLHIQEIATLSESRQRLARELIANQEETLRLLSRDLHDEFGQILTALGAMLARARRLAPDSQFEQEAREINQTVQEALEKVRALSQSLQPVILEEQGFVPALEWYLATYQRQHGIRIDYEKDGEAPQLTPLQAIHLYRIVQEALSNIARHARAAQAAVRWQHHAGQFQLQVQDRGPGIPADAARGIGLAAMRERAALMNARLAIASSKDGTMITVQCQCYGESDDQATRSARG